MSKQFDATTKELLELDPQGWLGCSWAANSIRCAFSTSIFPRSPPRRTSCLPLMKLFPGWFTWNFSRATIRTCPFGSSGTTSWSITGTGGPCKASPCSCAKMPTARRSPALLQQSLPDGALYHEFRYNVVRVWECPVDQILAGGLGTLPLAPLGKVTENELPSVIQSMRKRLDPGDDQNQAEMLWTATYLLMGLKYPEDLIEQLLPGVSRFP